MSTLDAVFMTSVSIMTGTKRCVRFLRSVGLFQVITVSSVPGMDSDWLMGERGIQKGKVPITYLELLN